ncbi:hypothetical protein LSH36_21g06004 [Paralvinella palmiformis]|uniref:Eukaryotic translation initiation factor 3 subunit G n=1 Tax=Paralvinella palmiformis TaxID=53620 RepID=A0AAD9KB49_9ANNE|nr:hypothetical protein LSH36_21g06004 [Paralvinella palmiformis]
MDAESDTKPSWADQVELGEDDTLPPPHEDFDENKGTKTITEIKFNDDGKKVKIVKTYKIETRKVSKSIARRKTLKKFGAASGDPPGPNPANTYISEDVFFQFVRNMEHRADDEDDPLSKLKNHKMVSCRICKGDHWTTRCPYKDTLAPIQDALDGDKKKEEVPEETQETPASSAPSRPGKYVPPNLRDGGNRRGETMTPGRNRDDTATIRVTNLSEDTRETDLQELFRPFGSIARIYLAKDKNTGQSKGFAFINFHRKEDAERAIAGVSGFGYDHLILNVEWAKPSGNQ